jgi:hypothetical protein
MSVIRQTNVEVTDRLMVWMFLIFESSYWAPYMTTLFKINHSDIAGSIRIYSAALSCTQTGLSVARIALFSKRRTYRWVASPQRNTSSACHLLSRWFLDRLILRPWRWRLCVPPKRRLTFNGLHGVISLKIALFLTHNLSSAKKVGASCAWKDECEQT